MAKTKFRGSGKVQKTANTALDEVAVEVVEEEALEEVPEEVPEEANKGTTIVSPGEQLKAKREELGLSQRAVANELHLTLQYIIALEANEFNKLPVATFVRGYLRSCAALLGLDPEQIIQSYSDFISNQERSSQAEEQKQKAKTYKDKNLPWLAFSAVALVFVVVLLWVFDEEDARPLIAQAATKVMATESAGYHTEKVAEAEAVAEVAEEVVIEKPQEDVLESAEKNVAIAATSLFESAGAEESESVQVDSDFAQQEVSSAIFSDNVVANVEKANIDISVVIDEENGTKSIVVVTSGDDLLNMKFSGESWVEIDNGQGLRLYNNLRAAGDQIQLTGTAPFKILLGQANRVEVSFNEKIVDFTPKTRGDNSARLTVGR